jgi:hypothetical protein
MGPKPTARDRTILRLKTRGLSNRGIAGRLGLSEMMIRKILRRLGWQPAPEATLPLLPKANPPTEPATISHSPSDHVPLPAAPPPPLQREGPRVKPAAQSSDQNPLDRSTELFVAKNFCPSERPYYRNEVSTGSRLGHKTFTLRRTVFKSAG